MFDLCYDCRNWGTGFCGNTEDCSCYEPADFDSYIEDEDYDGETTFSDELF